MSVINLWHGAVTSDGFRVRAKVTSPTAELLLSAHSDLAYASTLPAAIATAEGMVSFEVGGLESATQYYYALKLPNEPTDTTHPGRIRTFPTEGQPASFTFAASSCAGSETFTNGTYWPPEATTDTNVSNHPVFQNIKEADPDLFVHLGDLHYRDIGTNEISRYRQAIDDVLSAPNQSALFRSVPLAWMWDDHDYGRNDATKESPSRPAAIQSYRDRAPHYPLVDDEGVWQTWVIGRVRFIMPDLRTFTDDPTLPESPTKTMFGAKQWQWFQDTLNNAEEPLICWVNTVSWHNGAHLGSGWGVYQHERQRVTDFLVAGGFNERMFMVSGDWHGLGWEDGRNNPWGGFPIYHCSPLDSKPSANPNPFPFSHGTHIGRGHWGKFTIQDDGASINVLAEGMWNGEALLTHSFALGGEADDAGTPAGDLVIVRGMHSRGVESKKWHVRFNDQPAEVRAAHVAAIRW